MMRNRPIILILLIISLLISCQKTPSQKSVIEKDSEAINEVVEYPDYKPDKNSVIDKKHEQYTKVLKTLYENNPTTSVYFSPLYLLENEYISLDMITIDIKDINELKMKINNGLRTDYAITMLQLSTNVTMENAASNGQTRMLKKCIDEFNQLIEFANNGFTEDEATKLGYLALPHIKDNITRVNYNKYEKILISIAKEFDDKNVDIPTYYEGSLLWFEYYKEEIDTIREFISSEIQAVWLY